MVLLTGLAAYYAMDSTADVSGNGHTLTNYGATLTTGKIGNAYSFNGINNYISTPVLALTNSNFSMSAWIKSPATLTGASTIFAQGNTGTNNPIISIICLWTSNKFELVNRNNAAVGLVTYPTQSWTANTWYHIVWSCSLTQSTLYVNGVLINTTNFTANTGTFNAQTIGVRRRVGFGGYYNGKLDELGIWNRALTQAEITTLYNGGTGLTYPFSTGYSKKVNGITPGKVNGVVVANISKVNGI